MCPRNSGLSDSTRLLRSVLDSTSNVFLNIDLTEDVGDIDEHLKFVDGCRRRYLSEVLHCKLHAGTLEFGDGPPDRGFQNTTSIGSTVRPSGFRRTKPVPHRLKTAPVVCVACDVGEILVPLVGVALFAMGGVVEMMDDDDNCVGPGDRLITSLLELEVSFEDTTTDSSISLRSAL